jgi:hypothetical protein
MGKLIEQARGEVVLSADIMDYYAKNAEAFLAPEHLEPSSGEADVESSPFGVLFGVEPWNFPYYQLARFAAPHLMAGNVVRCSRIMSQFPDDKLEQKVPGTTKWNIREPTGLWMAWVGRGIRK